MQPSHHRGPPHRTPKSHAADHPHSTYGCHTISLRERWRTAGRHGGIVSRANASLPALSTRGDLGLLKTHADLMLLAKLSRRWRKIAEAFGVKLDPKSYGDHVRRSRQIAAYELCHVLVRTTNELGLLMRSFMIKSDLGQGSVSGKWRRVSVGRWGFPG